MEDEVEESTRSSTLTSVWVAEGGRERRTVRKVSWRRTACQTLRRCCLMKRGAVGTTGDFFVSLFLWMREGERAKKRKKKGEEEIKVEEGKERKHTNIGIPMQPHRIRLPHQNTSKRPPVAGVVIVNQKVRHQHHGLDARDARHAHITAHPQRLVGRARIKLGRLLFFPGTQIALHKLRAQSQHHKYQRDKGRVALVFLLQRHGPEVLVVREEGLSVDHGVDGVDAFKVPVENKVDLHFGGENIDHFG